jgi:gluconolactonase
MNLSEVCDGLEFPEGPIAMEDGSVLVVEIKAGCLTRVLPDGTKERVAHLGGGPNGAAIGPDGAVYVCNNGGFAWIELEGGLSAPHGKSPDYRGGSIQRVDLESGTVETLYTECDGRPLSGPNDIVFDADGGFWFTDIGKEHATGSDYGALYHAKPDGSAISRQRDKLQSPNGIGLSPDGRRLIVADTWACRLWAYDIAEPGTLAPASSPFVPGDLLVSMPAYTPFDSLAVEADGRVCAATCLKGGITIVGDDGAHEHLPVPDMITTNICFGGADMRDAWITGSSTGKLFKTRWPRPGLKLAFNS